MNLELVYTKASNKYVVVNHNIKTYCILEVKWKTSTELERVLELKVTLRFSDMKDFKKYFKGYK